MPTEKLVMQCHAPFRKFWVAAVVLLPLACSPSESPQGETATKQAPAQVRLAEVAEPKFENAKEFVASVKKANRATLYEGLPHQFFEQSSLDKELKGKKTVRFGDFPFYQETIPLKDKDFVTLQSIFGNIDEFKPYSGEKKCGGFHPDYCIEWYADDLLCRVLVCFGCGEIKAYCRKTGVHCDVASGVDDRLVETLKPYRKNRPAFAEPK